MSINITPDYNLFIQILFVLWVLKAIVLLLCGLTQADKLQRDKYGILEVIGGTFVLILSALVLA